MNAKKTVNQLLYLFWNDLPELNKEQIKEVVKEHLFEVIEKTPKSHVRKIASYKKQILQINRLIVCRL